MSDNPTIGDVLVELRQTRIDIMTRIDRLMATFNGTQHMNIREAIHLVEMAGDNPARDAVILSAAKRLGFPTLELRGRDSLDFREVAVNALREVLEAVYEAGRASNQPVES